MSFFKVNSLSTSYGLALVLICGLALSSAPRLSAQAIPLETATAFIELFRPEELSTLQRPFHDPRRKTWDRIPKVREGYRVEDMSIPQRTALHTMLHTFLTMRGYLLVTTIMFNEDIQQKREPELGRTQYWMEIFGTPAPDSLWGWQLEGHHLSLNLTYKGDSLISHTPFLIGSNPQVVTEEEERAGFMYLYRQELLIGRAVDSLTPEQREVGYSDAPQPNNMFGEIYRDTLYTPYRGLRVYEDSSEVLFPAKYVAVGYLSNIMSDDEYFFDLNKQVDTSDTEFFFMGDTKFNGRHYYSLYNKKHLIECENYGNHTHHLWRSTNDFGQEYIDKLK